MASRPNRKGEERVKQGVMISRNKSHGPPSARRQGAMRARREGKKTCESGEREKRVLPCRGKGKTSLAGRRKKKENTKTWPFSRGGK